MGKSLSHLEHIFTLCHVKSLAVTFFKFGSVPLSQAVHRNDSLAER